MRFTAKIKQNSGMSKRFSGGSRPPNPLAPLMGAPLRGAHAACGRAFRAAVSTGVDRGVDACINSPGAGVDTGVSTVPEQVLKRFNTTWNMC